MRGRHGDKKDISQKWKILVNSRVLETRPNPLLLVLLGNYLKAQGNKYQSDLKALQFKYICLVYSFKKILIFLTSMNGTQGSGSTMIKKQETQKLHMTF